MKHCRLRATMYVVCTLMAFPLSLAAQGRMFGHGDGPVDAATRRALIDTLLAHLRAEYVLPETAERMAAAVRAHERRGDYAALTSGQALAAKLSEDLNSVAHDKHLGVYYYDADMPVPAREGKPDPAVMADFRRRSERKNFGFEEVRVLRGNVGYIRLTGFHPVEWGADAAASALKLVANTEALILDLRGNTGGSADMVQLLMSYFVPGRTHLNDMHMRSDSARQQFWSLPAVPGGRYGTGKPLYVLTDRKTISAGEELPYDVKALKRGKVVGEVTAGAANPGGMERLDAHFAVFMPVGRAINPVTGTNWEGAGVQPDIAVPAAKALDTAHLHALQELLPKTTDPAGVADLRAEISRLEEALR